MKKLVAIIVAFTLVAAGIFVRSAAIEGGRASVVGIGQLTLSDVEKGEDGSLKLSKVDECVACIHALVPRQSDIVLKQTSSSPWLVRAHAVKIASLESQKPPPWVS